MVIDILDFLIDIIFDIVFDIILDIHIDIILDVIDIVGTRIFDIFDKVHPPLYRRNTR